jgi:hypothetical protein
MEAHVITTLKLAGLSAVLSAGLVSGITAPEQRLSSGSGKLFHDRVSDGLSTAPFTFASTDHRAIAPVQVNAAGKAHRVRTRQEVRCTDQAWLLVPADCVPRFDASSARTSEVRSSGNVSALIQGGALRALASR